MSQNSPHSLALQTFVWSERFETGVELIDHQHQALVGLTNALGEALVGGDAAECERVLAEVQAYAEYHFDAEEAWWAQAGVPPTALAAHHGRHSEFGDQLTQFSALWAQGGQQAAALHRFLSAWLIVHILGEDREMVQRLSQLPDAAVQAPRTLGDGEVVLLEAVRNLQGALAGLNAGLDQRVRESTAELARANQRLKDSFLTSIRTFTSMMELRGGMLAGHSRRVAELAQRLAKQLGLDDPTVQQVFLGGLLHDIGKIGLPDELLGKPVTQMNAQEVALYRKHPVAGVQALIALDDLQPAANALRSHHERFDGKGFPDGLAGEAIPLEARILAVANDFDGLQHGLISSRRLSVNEALQFVQDQVGQRYDPQVVGALLQVMGRSAEGRGPERVVLSAELMPGMTLSRDLVTPEGMLLLAADSPLEAGLIRRIQVYLGQAGHRPLQVHVRHEAQGGDVPAPSAA